MNQNIPCQSPAKYKLVILTFAGLLGPVLLIPSMLNQFIVLPKFLVDILAVIVIVLLMTYIIMPLLLRVFSFWLKENNSLAKNK